MTAEQPRALDTNSSSAETTFEAREFRSALGLFATGVAIITADVKGVRIGATVSSFNSVSLSPPLVLFSLARRAYGLSQWQAAKAYAVAVLGEDQDAISNRFAKSGEDKWQGIEVRRAVNGSPLLPNWLACFECEPYARYDGGDHEIFVGRVTALTVRKAVQPRPLIFFAGRYRAVRSDGDIPTPPDANVWLHGW
jgi:flavin reductase (DIM6/NTAB) family NADH-FMN oxidoreductase RutF